MDDLYQLALTAARASGALLRERFRQPRTEVGTKSSGTDMVTDADRSAEALIFEGIRSERPDDAVLGEESGDTPGSSGLRWVIDPLDGTTNFLFGIPHWAVSIACEDARGTVVGVVYDALRDEMFAAARGGGATLNGEVIEVSGARDLSQALIATGFSYLPDERAVASQMLEEVLPSVRDIRRAGAASLDVAWVASGRHDGYYEVPTHLWDYAAAELIAREAGARSESLEAIGPSGPGLMVSSPGIFDGLRALVIKAREGSARRP